MELTVRMVLRERRETKDLLETKGLKVYLEPQE